MQGGGPADVACLNLPGLPQRGGRGQRLEPWGAPSSLGDPLPDAKSLGGQDSFPVSLSHDNISLHSQTPLYCVSGPLTAPGCRFVSEL